MILRQAWRPVAGLGSEHGAGDREQAVRDRTQGTGVGGHAAHDELVLAGLPCDGCDAREAPQRLVVPARQRLGRLGEQRGEDGLADSGQGGEDRHVALPADLVGVGVLAVVQGVDQACDLPLGVCQTVP